MCEWPCSWKYWSPARSHCRPRRPLRPAARLAAFAFLRHMTVELQSAPLDVPPPWRLAPERLRHRSVFGSRPNRKSSAFSRRWHGCKGLWQRRLSICTKALTPRPLLCTGRNQWTSPTRKIPSAALKGRTKQQMFLKEEAMTQETLSYVREGRTGLLRVWCSTLPSVGPRHHPRCNACCGRCAYFNRYTPQRTSPSSISVP